MNVKSPMAAVALAAALSLAALIATGSNASAEGACNGSQCGAPAASNGQTITVTVSGSFVSGGSAGHGGGTTTVTVSPTCSYLQSSTGKSYYDSVTSPDGARIAHQTGETGPPTPGYEAHKDDTTGHYYIPSCISTNYGTNIPAFFAFSDAWMAAHTTVYVAAGQTPPVPLVAPELLVEAAQKAMTLPLPLFDHNPKAGANAFTLVNLPTWFWLENPTTTGRVTARIPGSSATITATLASAMFSSPSAGSVPCAGTGVRWSPGATSDCTLTFPHQTPAETVTAATSWGLHWVYDGQLGHREGDLAAVGSQDTAAVPVREAQAITTSAS